MKNIVIFLAALFFAVYAYAAKPNVVIIYADDLGYGDVSYGDKTVKIQTPTIDALADSGMTFFDGHSSSGLCSSSRYAILTGSYHWRRFHGIVYGWENSIFKPNEFTMAKMFKAKGYKTACIGKWHLGWNWKSIIKEGVKPRVANQKAGNREKSKYLVEDFYWSKKIENGPTSLGFDYYFGDDSINFPPYCWIENDVVLTAPSKMMPMTYYDSIREATDFFRAGPMSEDWQLRDVLPTLKSKAIEYISKQNADEPFFLYFALSSPHAPVLPNEEFEGSSRAGLYGDFVQQTDADIAEIIAELERKGLRENTIIVFSSDNGPEAKYATVRKKDFGHNSSGVLRGYKRDMYEGGHRVPFIVSWQAKIQAGQKTNAIINQVDLVATFAEIIDYKLAKNEAVDSYSMLPVFLSEKDFVRNETIYNTKSGKYALRQGDWVFFNGDSSKKKSSFMLYNLKDDISQKNDLSSQYPEKVQALNTLLSTYLKAEGTAPHTH